MRMIDLLTELGEAFEDIKKEQEKQKEAIKMAKHKRGRR